MNYQSASMAMVDHTLKSDKFNCLSRDYNKIRVIEPLVTSAVKNTTNDLKTSLDGIEFSVKTASSVEDKLLRSEAKHAQTKAIHSLPKTPCINLKILYDIQKSAITMTLRKSPRKQLTQWKTRAMF